MFFERASLLYLSIHLHLLVIQHHSVQSFSSTVSRFSPTIIMGSKHLPLKDSGIFKNLPTFSPDIKGLTAIITGANGISGFHTMRVLLESPQRWKKVYAISRRPPPPEMMALLPEEHRSRVQHVASDFLSKPQDIAKALTDAKVTADVIFFYSYAQPKPKPGSGAWSNAQELVEVNCTIRDFPPSPLPTNLPL